MNRVYIILLDGYGSCTFKYNILLLYIWNVEGIMGWKILRIEILTVLLSIIKIWNGKGQGNGCAQLYHMDLDYN